MLNLLLQGLILLARSGANGRELRYLMCTQGEISGRVTAMHLINRDENVDGFKTNKKGSSTYWKSLRKYTYC